MRDFKHGVRFRHSSCNVTKNNKYAYKIICSNLKNIQEYLFRKRIKI